VSVQAPVRGRGLNITAIIFVGFALTILALILFGYGPWSILFVNPLINALVFLDIFTFGSFGLAIILFTVILRVATVPFTIRQLESTRAMQAIQPEMQEIQKKYKDPKRRQEEMLRLYRENHINPLGCFMPLVIQMVVFIALNQALRYTVGGSPESLIGLSQRLYPLEFLEAQIPLNQHFLWLNLGQPDSTFILPLLVGVSTYVQTRLSATPSPNPQMQQQQQMMTWMMPLVLVFITLNLPSGVGVYWVVSNIFSLIASYWVYGRRILSWRQLLPLPPEPAAQPDTARQAKSAHPSLPVSEEGATDTESTSAEPEAPADTEARSDHGKRRGRRKKRR
jgi:YidC/Oxa1 family membrane protein insertase